MKPPEAVSSRVGTAGLCGAIEEKTKRAADRLPRLARLVDSVRPTGIEPARDCSHQALNLARLPIPPRPQESQWQVYSIDANGQESSADATATAS
jgi:hypothetical protein